MPRPPRGPLTRLLPLLLLPLVVVALTGAQLPPAGSGTTGAPVSAQASAQAVAEPERRTVTVGGTSRPYLLVRPAPGARVLGAVMVAHAQNQTMGQAERTYRLDHLPQRGQLVAYLGGQRGSWNSGGCCGEARAQGVDDLGYVRAVLADLRTMLPADRTAAFMGYSSGGMLAYSLVCHARLDLKLVVSVSGTRSAGCTDARLPYRFIELHGAKDTTIPLDPPTRRSAVLGVAPIPTRPATRTLAEASGCTYVRDGGRYRTDHGGCRAGSVVRLVVQRDAGHSYTDLRAPFVLTRALEEIGQMTP